MGDKVIKILCYAGDAYTNGRKRERSGMTAT